jgi:alanyl-tRNA synthetase
MERFEYAENNPQLSEKFDSREISKYFEDTENLYADYFAKEGLSKREHVDLVAKEIDPSVLFIGSSVSALKSVYLNNDIPPNGVTINQPCIRTHNLKNIFNEKPNKGNTFFHLMGGIACDDKLLDVYNLSLKYFSEGLKINRDRLLVRASSADKDILEKINRTAEGPQIELDSRQLDYYRWKYGIDGVSGRGIAFAIRNEVHKEKAMWRVPISFDTFSTLQLILPAV